MARNDPVERNMIRMELRRFQIRCEAQEGSIQRADSVREIARLANIAIPYLLIEEVDAQDARKQVRQLAETRARELFEELFERLVRAEPQVRDKLRRAINEEFAQLNGHLNPLRTWAQARQTAVEQMLAE